MFHGLKNYKNNSYLFHDNTLFNCDELYFSLNVYTKTTINKFNLNADFITTNPF